MKIQSISPTICILDRFALNLEFCLSPRWAPAPQPDANFYEDEAALARELAAPVPARGNFQSPPEIDPDQFEAIYLWFLA